MRAARRARFIAEVLGIYTISRLVGFATLLIVERQLHGQRFPGGFAFHLWRNVFDRWDAGFYRMVSTDGYPTVLPTNERGELLASTWAFFPAFPVMAGGLSRLTGIGFEGAAVLLNVVAGGLAAVCLARLARWCGDDAVALRTVALWAFFPTAFVLQVPYSEAVYSAFAAAFLLALLRRRYVLSIGLLLAAALSRGYAIPLSGAALGVFVGETAFFRRRLSPGLIALAAAAVVAPFLWAGIAAVATGRLDAFTATQQVWGFSLDPVVWLTRWWNALGYFGRDAYFTMVVLTIVGVIVLAAVSLTRPMPTELRVYTLLATVFLIAISQPEAIAFGSIPRFAFGILTIPLMLALVVENRTTAAVVAAYVGLQYLWVLDVWSGRLGIAP